MDSGGAVANQLRISTASYEFAVIRWPSSELKPHLLLTEERKIRIVDLNGDTVIQVDAPGCREFGHVKAVTIKFRKEEPEYLAVKKNLHPDLSVLYVFDPNGKLVYQKTEVIEGVLGPTLAAVPAKETGREKLLAGSARNYRSQVFEYSLAR